MVRGSGRARVSSCEAGSEKEMSTQPRGNVRGGAICRRTCKGERARIRQRGQLSCNKVTVKALAPELCVLESCVELGKVTCAHLYPEQNHVAIPFSRDGWEVALKGNNLP